MSDKEVTVFVIDLGKQMKKCEKNRNQSNHEWVLEYFWSRISSKVLSGRKTDYVGVVGFKTDDTNNDMEDDKFYENISVLCSIQQITIKEIKELKKQLIPSNTDVGDAISAVIIGIDLISNYCRNLKYIKNLVLITNGESDMNFSDLEKIAYQIKYMCINFSIIGIDFDTKEYKEVSKNIIKLNNEKNLLKFSNISNGTFSSMTEAMNSLNIPSIRKVRPVSLFSGILSIGYSQNYSNVIEIMIQRYPRTRLAKKPAAHRYNVSETIQKSTDHSKKSIETSINSSDDDKDECFNEIIMTKSYKIKEDDEEIEIFKEDLELGYIYGKTIIPISIMEEEELVYKEDTGLTILGFIKNKSFPRFIILGEANIIVPAKANLNAKISLSSLVHAMLKTNTLALARFVTKTNKFPEMIIMAPSIEDNFECLIELTIPFSEDCKNFKFPSIKKDNTSSNKNNSSMDNSMDHIDSLMESFVKKMDLSNKTQNNNIGKQIFSQSIHIYNIASYRLSQAISSAAIYPDLELEKILPDIKQFMYPSDDLLKNTQKEIEALSKLFNIKKPILNTCDSTIS